MTLTNISSTADTGQEAGLQLGFRLGIWSHRHSGVHAVVMYKCRSSKSMESQINKHNAIFSKIPCADSPHNMIRTVVFSIINALACCEICYREAMRPATYVGYCMKPLCSCDRIHHYPSPKHGRVPQPQHVSTTTVSATTAAIRLISTNISP